MWKTTITIDINKVSFEERAQLRSTLYNKRLTLQLLDGNGQLAPGSLSFQEQMSQVPMVQEQMLGVSPVIIKVELLWNHLENAENLVQIFTDEHPAITGIIEEID